MSCELKFVKNTNVNAVKLNQIGENRQRVDG